ncbi:MAG: glycoside hydrolase family 127 protein [Solirubrobacteraceae bacterium]
MRPVAPTRGALRPLGVDAVRLEPGFWGDRQDLNAEVVLRHCHGWMDRLGWIENFRAPARHRGREFADSDVYKLAEGLAWEVGRSGDGDLDRLVGEIADAAAGAQEPDGYLNTRFGHRGREHRYTDLEWGHELYCYGHLIQAAVARLRTRGEDRLVQIALRAADHVCAEFGPGGRKGVCGHPEIEMALVELYRATGEERYLEQARLFVERRGRPALADVEYGRQYFQDDVPVREAAAFRGHAVRALYLASGAADVAVETGDDELLAAIVRQWERTVAARTYVTGGMGSRHTDESFGEDYELPPDRAYSETCAGVASVMLAWRLLLATGEARFADLAERTLYNVVATSPALDGRAFFYANPLHQRVPGAPPQADAESPRAAASLRAPWFSVSCCPTNVARTLSSLAAYVATADAVGVQIHQLTPCTIRATLAGVGDVALRVQTGYPWSGDVVVRIEAAGDSPWRLSLRVPGWAGEAVLVEGDRRRVVPSGYAVVDKVWRAGEEVRIELPVRPRWTRPDPRVDAVRGCVAVERGPLVYCLESTDHDAGVPLDSVAAMTGAEPVERPAGGVLDGAVALEGPGRVVAVPERPAERATRLTFVPYHLWGNRGASTMRVWVPEGRE